MAEHVVDTRSSRWGAARLVVAALCVCLLLAACGSSPESGRDQGEAAEPTAPTADQPQDPSAPGRIAIVGIRDISFDDLAVDVEGLGYEVETRPASLDRSTDLVLFAVSAQDGPMVPTRDQLRALEGSLVTRAGVALTNVRPGDDVEIHELVVIEMAELLADFGITPVDRKTVIGEVGTDLGTALATLLRRPPWDWEVTEVLEPEPATPTGPVAVPPLVNVPLDSALAVLQDEGLMGIVIGRIEYGLDSACYPPVMELVPPPTTLVDRGSSVALLVPFPDPQDPALAPCLLPELTDGEVDAILEDLQGG